MGWSEEKAEKMISWNVATQFQPGQSGNVATQPRFQPGTDATTINLITLMISRDNHLYTAWRGMEIKKKKSMAKTMATLVVCLPKPRKKYPGFEVS